MQEKKSPQIRKMTMKSNHRTKSCERDSKRSLNQNKRSAANPGRQAHDAAEAQDVPEPQHMMTQDSNAKSDEHTSESSGQTTLIKV
jgi:hypothetical protein